MNDSKPLNFDELRDNITFSLFLDMTLRYGRYRDHPEHPIFRSTLQSLIDIVSNKGLQSASWFERRLTPFMARYFYHFIIRRVKVARIPPNEAMDMLQRALAEIEEYEREQAKVKPSLTCFNTELLEVIRCPIDNGPLRFIKDEHEREWLLNPRKGYRYPIQDGIPILLVEKGRKDIYLKNDKDRSFWAKRPKT